MNAKKLSKDENYLIYSEGKVYSKYSKKFLKTTISNGYYAVYLKGKINKMFRIHRLVAEYFIENPDNLRVVNHKNGNKLDNNYLNLEWTTYKQNSRHALETGLASSKHKRKIIQYNLDMNVIGEYESITDAAKKTNYSERQILDHCKGRVKTSKRFYFKYKNDNNTINPPKNSKQLYNFPNYLISKEGKIYSKVRNKYLKTNMNKDGYELANISKNGKKYSKSVHRLVMETYNPNNDKTKTQIHHKDNNRSNNCLDNLEWCTPSYNMKQAVLNGGKKSSCRKVCNINPQTGEVVNTYNSIVEASKQCKVHPTSISNACRGLIKILKGFVWEYVDNE